MKMKAFYIAILGCISLMVFAEAPQRLRTSGRTLLGGDGQAVTLRGVNLEGIKKEDPALISSLGFNAVRLRVSFEAPNTAGKGAQEVFTPVYLAEVRRWAELLSKEGIWILVELRSRDELTNGKELYSIGSPENQAYRNAWLSLVRTLRDIEYIAGYGLLAEPSTNRKWENPVAALTAFQKDLMDAITKEGGDASTLFFIGTDWNYDSFQYRFDEYWTAFAPYHHRIVYEVNFLVPKPWIKDGSVPRGVPPEQGRFPQPRENPDFAALVQPALGDSRSESNGPERTFSKNSLEARLFPLLLHPQFPEWYLSPALAFSIRHEVPMCIDQFGASVEAEGWEEFEQNLILWAEGNSLGWFRWSYNAGSGDRMIQENPRVQSFYRDILKKR